MKKDKYLWRCPCGNRVTVSAKRVKLGLESCPSCGRLVGSPSENASSPSAADTQTINVKDMARMAQAGINVEVSGEWDTSTGNRRGKPAKKNEAE
jgi:hypothetical protein